MVKHQYGRRRPSRPLGEERRQREEFREEFREEMKMALHQYGWDADGREVRMTGERDEAILHQQRLGAAMQDEIRGRHTAERERDEARAEVEQANADANALTLERDEWESRYLNVRADADEWQARTMQARAESERLTRERDEANARAAVILEQERLLIAAERERDEARASVLEHAQYLQKAINERATAERERDKWKDRALGAEMGVGSLKSETALARHERDEMWEALRCDARAKETLIRERDEARAEVTKAMEALDYGCDDERWAPGTTAVDSLIRENERLRARVANLERGIEAYRAEWDCRLPQGGRECSMGCCSCAWEREQREGADRDPTVL